MSFMTNNKKPIEDRNKTGMITPTLSPAKDLPKNVIKGSGLLFGIPDNSDYAANNQDEEFSSAILTSDQCKQYIEEYLLDEINEQREQEHNPALVISQRLQQETAFRGLEKSIDLLLNGSSEELHDVHDCENTKDANKLGFSSVVEIEFQLVVGEIEGSKTVAKEIALNAFNMLSRKEEYRNYVSSDYKYVALSTNQIAIDDTRARYVFTIDFAK